MLTYTFSRREKALILFLALVLVALAWYMLVFQGTNDQIAKIDAEIADVQTQQTMASAKMSKMRAMQSTIEKQKAAGVKAKPVPEFDNMRALMAELNGIMSSTTTYTLSFDELDTKTSAGYVLRGVNITYGCPTLSAAESVVRALSDGSFPCSIDSVSISDSSVKGSSRVTGTAGVGVVSATIHATFFEKVSS